MTTVDFLLAKIRLQLAFLLARDILEFRNGDKSRFGRMVDGKGKQVGTLSSHLRAINGIVSDEQVKSNYPVTCRMIAAVVGGMVKEVASVH